MTLCMSFTCSSRLVNAWWDIQQQLLSAKTQDSFSLVAVAARAKRSALFYGRFESFHCWSSQLVREYHFHCLSGRLVLWCIELHNSKTEDRNFRVKLSSWKAEPDNFTQFRTRVWSKILSREKKCVLLLVLLLLLFNFIGNHAFIVLNFLRWDAKKQLHLIVTYLHQYN